MKALGPSKGHHFFPREISLSCYLHFHHTITLNTWVWKHYKITHFPRNTYFIHKIEKYQTERSQIRCSLASCTPLCIRVHFICKHGNLCTVVPKMDTKCRASCDSHHLVDVIILSREHRKLRKNRDKSGRRHTGFSGITYQLNSSDIFVWNWYNFAGFLGSKNDRFTVIFFSKRHKLHLTRFWHVLVTWSCVVGT